LFVLVGQLLDKREVVLEGLREVHEVDEEVI